MSNDRTLVYATIRKRWHRGHGGAVYVVHYVMSDRSGWYPAYFTSRDAAVQHIAGVIA